MDFNIDHVLKELSNERPIFHSEDDFKFSLAWIIKREYPQAKIRLEYTPDFDRNIHIDIVVILDGQLIPIELKYKTKELDLTLGAERYILKEQVSTNDTCYNFIKDITRIEIFKNKESNFKEGYAIFLANRLLYEKGPTNDKLNYINFAINDGNTKKGELFYLREGVVVSDDKNYPALSLEGEYIFNWKEYSSIEKYFNINIEDSKFKNAKEFKYLAIKIS